MRPRPSLSSFHLRRFCNVNSTFEICIRELKPEAGSVNKGAGLSALEPKRLSGKNDLEEHRQSSSECATHKSAGNPNIHEERIVSHDRSDAKKAGITRSISS